MVYSVLRDLTTALADANARIRDLEARLERMFRPGKVTDVDTKKQQYRQVVGVDKDGNDVKSPWIHYHQIAGTRKVHTPPSKGQQMMQVAFDGNFEQGLGVPLTWWEENPSPSEDPDEDVDVRGKSRWTQRDASVVRQVDGLTVSHTKQSHSLTVHKDPETKDEGKDETVDDAHPWKGNRAKKKHSRAINKDAGYALKINDGDDQKEHKVTLHPDDAYEVSTHKGKHSIKVNSSGIKAKTDAAYEREAQTHIKDKASQILHEGPTDVQGTLNVSQLATFGQNINVGGLGAFAGGLSTGALEVATDANGGLVQATMGLEIGGVSGGLSFGVLPPDYADDTAAAAGGVPVNHVYRTGSVLKVRIV